MRTAEIKRKTAETDIVLKLNADGSGKSDINTGVGFLDHMLTLFSRHGRFDIELVCRGDVDVDDHHSVEDIGICLGKCFYQALGDMRGIKRYGDIILPMDEALILCAVDISGRASLNCDIDIPSEKIGTFDTELIEEFLQAFLRNFPISLHIKQLSGKNSHHIAEGIFKALGRTLRKAVEIDRVFADEIPSTKGVL